MEYRTLSNGVRMPMLGYGVFQIDDATTERCVKDAIASGYRMIDTAQAYGNERGYGPRGRGYIAHVDVPARVRAAWGRLREALPGLVREANPAFATRG